MEEVDDDIWLWQFDFDEVQKPKFVKRRILVLYLCLKAHLGLDHGFLKFFVNRILELEPKIIALHQLKQKIDTAKHVLLMNFYRYERFKVYYPPCLIPGFRSVGIYPHRQWEEKMISVRMQLTGREPENCHPIRVWNRVFGSPYAVNYSSLDLSVFLSDFAHSQREIYEIKSK